MTAPFQFYPDLEPAVEAALRSSMRRWGPIYPVVVTQHGKIIDGHHRKRIADELGIKIETKVRRVRNDEEAVELARTLNEDRRHLWPVDQRREMVEELAAETDEDGVGVHTPDAIAGALGVSRATIHNDIAQHVSPDKLPSHRRGHDDKVRPAVRPDPRPVTPEVEAENTEPPEALGDSMAHAIENEPTVSRSFAQTDLHRALSAVVKLRASYQDPAAAADLVPEDERDDEAQAADDAIAWFESFRKRLRQSHLRVVTGSGR